MLIVAFIVLRTAFLTTLETPEPRYVLVCFPALIALAAQIFARPRDPYDIDLASGMIRSGNVSRRKPTASKALILQQVPGG